METHIGLSYKTHLHDVLVHVDKTKFGVLLSYDTEMYKKLFTNFKSA